MHYRLRISEFITNIKIYVENTNNQKYLLKGRIINIAIQSSSKCYLELFIAIINLSLITFLYPNIYKIMYYSNNKVFYLASTRSLFSFKFVFLELNNIYS